MTIDGITQSFTSCFNSLGFRLFLKLLVETGIIVIILETLVLLVLLLIILILFDLLSLVKYLF